MGAAVIGRDHEWLLEAIEESRRCPTSTTAFAVGAIIVSGAGEELARGHSRQEDPHDHAEEVALAHWRQRGGESGGAPRAAGVTLYSSLEPCSTRRSRPLPCSELVIASGIRRVVFAAREPELFVECHGVADLTAAGVGVVELDEMAGLVRAVNAHLDWPTPVRR